jgi:hypothetical protein
MIKVLTIDQYFEQWGVHYLNEITDEIRANAAETVARANKLIETLHEVNLTAQDSPRTGSPITSGWRPKAVNAATKGSAPHSNHITGRAIDLYDPDGDLDEFFYENTAILEDLELWMEHPSATKGWCHVQTVPPSSGRRVFYP